MSDVFTNILGSLKNIGTSVSNNPLQSGLSLMQAISNMSIANKEKAAVDRAVWYSKNPQAISQLQSQFEKPLDQGLIKGTENIVNASLAQQGLSQAPGIQSQVESQALAPYIQNNQNTALVAAFKALGLPAEALAALGNMQSPGALAAQLKSILPQQPIIPRPSLPQAPNSYPSLAPPWDTSPLPPPTDNPGAGTGG